MSKFKFSLLITTLLTAFFAFSNGNAAITVIQNPDGKNADIESYQSENEIYIKMAALARFLDGDETVDFISKSGKSEFGKLSIEYSLFSTYVKSGDDIYDIYKPVEFHDGSFYLPVRYLAMILNLISGQEYNWDGKTLKISPPDYNVIGLNASQKMNGLLLEIYMRDNLKFSAVKAEDNWVVVTIADGKIDSMAFINAPRTRAIYELKTYQFEKSCQISIKLRPREFTFTSKVREDPLRIQVLVRGESFSDSTMIAESQSKEVISDNPIDVIVIDPGHGGVDNGATGTKGRKEKDIVLKIAQNLYKLLKDDGRFKPVMTRQDDIFVPLAKRTEMANTVGGDLFISIHANAARNKKASGFIAFSLAVAKTDQARAAASLENGSIKFENVETQKLYNSDLDFTLRDMVQSEYQRESIDLADIIQKNVSHSSEIGSRGIDQAGFFVLDKAYMPAVLVETAFISNLRDEKKLASPDFQMKTARAIYDSIVAFRNKYERQ